MVYLATTAVSQIPLAALAGVLMITATRMISRSTVRSVITASKSDAAVFIGTAIVTVSFDLIIAVGIGIAAAAFFALRTLAASGGVHREEIPETRQPGDDEIAIFRLDGALFFGAADRMIEEINRIRNVSVVILRLSQLQVLDATGARVITELVQSLERRRHHGPDQGDPGAPPPCRHPRRCDLLTPTPESPLHGPACRRRARPQSRPP